MVSVKPLPVSVASQEAPQSDSLLRRRSAGRYGWLALKSFLLVPLFPLVGFWLLDQTGFSQWLIGTGFMPEAILGEGFGHVGLCFSIHYLFTGFRAAWKAISLLVR